MASIAISWPRVWVGFDQERPLGEGEEGSRTAVPIWVSFMREALARTARSAATAAAGTGEPCASRRRPELWLAANDADAIYETFMEDHLPPAASTGNSPPGGGPQTVPGSAEPLF